MYRQIREGDNALFAPPAQLRYRVYAEFEDTYGVSRWHPVRNFGEYQSEAYYFMRHAYELSEPRLRLLAESFDPDVVVVNSGRKFGEFKKVRRERVEELMKRE